MQSNEIHPGLAYDEQSVVDIFNPGYTSTGKRGQLIHMTQDGYNCDVLTLWLTENAPDLIQHIFKLIKMVCFLSSDWFCNGYGKHSFSSFPQAGIKLIVSLQEA